MFALCKNVNCKYNWVDTCTRSLEGESIIIDISGKCSNFEKGKSEYYDYNKALLEDESKQV